MSNGERRIRPYGEADQPQIEWLYCRTPPAGQISARPQALPLDLQQIPAQYAHFLVMSELQRGEEAIVGMVGIEEVGAHQITPGVPPHLWLPARAARLRHVAVAPERQRSGIGRLLVDAAVAWCREQQYESVILETTPQQEAAVNLYVALGFVEIARSKVGSYDLIWFECRL